MKKNSSLIDLHDKSPNLLRIIELVSKKPSSKEENHVFVEGQDATYFEFAEDLSTTILKDFLTREEEQIEAAASYNKMYGFFKRANSIQKNRSLLHR